MINYTHTGDFVFFSPPHGVLFSAICSIERADRERRRYLQIWRHATQGVRSILSAPRTQALLRRGFFFSRFRLFGGDKSPTSKTKTRIRPLFRHALTPQNLRFWRVRGNLNAQYTCLRCLNAHEITLWTRLRGLDRVSYPHRGAYDSFRRRTNV